MVVRGPPELAQRFALSPEMVHGCQRYLPRTFRYG